MIYFILITPKFFFKLGQKKVPSSGEKRWYTSLMYFCTLNWFGAKLWSQIPTGWNISGTAGSIREVKPACVRPNVKEFKHWFFFFFPFDCRAGRYGGQKEQKERVASSQVQMAKIPSESWHLYHPKQDKRVLPGIVACFCHSILLPVYLFPLSFPALTLCPRYHPANILSTVFPSPWFRLLCGSGFAFSHFLLNLISFFFYFLCPFFSSLIHDNRNQGGVGMFSLQLFSLSHWATWCTDAETIQWIHYKKVIKHFLIWFGFACTKRAHFSPKINGILSTTNSIPWFLNKNIAYR